MEKKIETVVEEVRYLVDAVREYATTTSGGAARYIAGAMSLLDRAIAALSIIEPADPWRPIETAPKDGTLIDAYVGGTYGGRCTDVKWGESNDPLRPSREKEWVAKDDIVGWYPVGPLTHWMPRPPKPLPRTPTKKP